MKNSKVLANQTIIRRYQYRSWYLLVILIFICAWGVLQLFHKPIISPCASTGCEIAHVYESESKTQLQQIIDYIVIKFSPEGDRVVTQALACFISESHLNPQAYHYNSNATWDFGVAQWNQVHGQTIDQIRDWHKQIDLAYGLYKSSGNSFRAWYGQYCQ